MIFLCTLLVGATLALATPDSFAAQPVTQPAVQPDSASELNAERQRLVEPTPSAAVWRDPIPRLSDWARQQQARAGNNPVRTPSDVSGVNVQSARSTGAAGSQGGALRDPIPRLN